MNILQFGHKYLFAECIIQENLLRITGIKITFIMNQLKFILLVTWQVVRRIHQHHHLVLAVVPSAPPCTAPEERV